MSAVYPSAGEGYTALREARAAVHQQRHPEDSKAAPDDMESHAQQIADHLECPVCLDLLQHAVEAQPCGHAMCGTCAVEYWTRAGIDRPIKCPLDRQEVTGFLKSFTLRSLVKTVREAQQRQEQSGSIAGIAVDSVDDGDASQTDAEIERYNLKFQPVSGAAIADDLAGAQQAFHNFNLMTWAQKFIVVVAIFFAVIYFISPVDLLPESALGPVGLSDDAFVVFAVLLMVGRVFRQAVLARSDELARAD
jgi:E3 ubiquitin-protein ligase RNF170